MFISNRKGLRSLVRIIRSARPQPRQPRTRNASRLTRWISRSSSAGKPDGNYDYQNKYFKNDTRYLVPSGLPAGEEADISALVLQAYRVLGCRGWARADVMIDARSRQPYLLEINTAPGMTGHSLVPMSARADGISYEDLCLQLLAGASLDYATEGAHG